MKLFRRQEPKSTHPHAAALSHVSNAHRALMKENLEDARSHLGRAFAAVHHAMPKEAKPDTASGMTSGMPVLNGAQEPDIDDGQAQKPSKSNTTNAFARLRGLNRSQT